MARRTMILSAATAALAVGLSACGDAGGAAERAAKLNGAAAEAGYRPPLRTAAVGVSPDGAVSLRGRAPEGARVRAMLPGDVAYGATAGDDGGFVIELPRSVEPRLVELQADQDGRSLLSEGWLFVPPDRPGAAATLRAGAAAVPLPGAPLLATVDYDGAGAAAVAGRTVPNTPVRVFLDGVAAGRGQSDAEGAFAVRLNGPVRAGAHALRVETDKAAVERRVSLESKAPSGVFAAERVEAGWRVDWTPPGGGAQSTLVLIEPAA